MNDTLLWIVLWVAAGMVGAVVAVREVGELTVAGGLAAIFAAVVGGPVVLFVATMVTVGQRVLWRRKE